MDKGETQINTKVHCYQCNKEVFEGDSAVYLCWPRKNPRITLIGCNDCRLKSEMLNKITK